MAPTFYEELRAMGNELRMDIFRPAAQLAGMQQEREWMARSGHDRRAERRSA
jgi:pilus assembly protein CpaF